MIDTIQEIARIILVVIAVIFFILLGIALVVQAFSKAETRLSAETCQATSPPKIDREAALELLESGECIGVEIEDGCVNNKIGFGEKKGGNMSIQNNKVRRIKIVSTEAEIIQIDTGKGGSMRAYDPCGNMLSPMRIVELLKEAVSKIRENAYYYKDEEEK